MWLRSVVGSAADRYHMHDDWTSFCLCVPRRCHTSTAMACGMLGHRPSGCTWVVLSGRNRRHCFCLSPFAMPRICCFLRAALPQSWQRVRSRRHMHTYVLLCARVTSKTTKKQVEHHTKPRRASVTAPLHMQGRTRAATQEQAQAVAPGTKADPLHQRSLAPGHSMPTRWGVGCHCKCKCKCK